MTTNVKKRNKARIIQSCWFNKEAEPEKYYRELIMLFTSWRNEEVDLISSCASYQSRYQQLCHSIREKMKEYAIYDQDFAKLEQQMATVEEHYDRIAPCTQDIEHQDEMEGNTDLTPELNESL